MPVRERGMDLQYVKFYKIMFISRRYTFGWRFKSITGKTWNISQLYMGNRLQRWIWLQRCKCRVQTAWFEVIVNYCREELYLVTYFHYLHNSYFIRWHAYCRLQAFCRLFKYVSSVIDVNNTHQCNYTIVI